MKVQRSPRSGVWLPWSRAAWKSGHPGLWDAGAPGGGTPALEEVHFDLQSRLWLSSFPVDFSS